ncbi:MAG: hypothetical protein ACRBBQ_05265 [Cognatishimia sp.]
MPELDREYAKSNPVVRIPPSGRHLINYLVEPDNLTLVRMLHPPSSTV